MKISKQRHQSWRIMVTFSYIFQCFFFTRMLSQHMPCIRPNIRQPRRFLPHFPPGSMRCRFSPELVPDLPHAMSKVFPKTESGPDIIVDLSTFLLSASASGSGSSPPLIPKPSGEVGHVGRGGYTLKTVLEEEHGWENRLYNKIRVCIIHS